MVFVDFLFALVVAMLLSVLVVLGLNWRRPDRDEVWPSFLFVLLFIFMLTWIGGVWVNPFGPVVWGGYWLPFVFAGIFFAVLLLALIPPHRRRPRTVEPATEPEVVVGSVIGGFFWLLLLAVLAGLIIRYLS